MDQIWARITTAGRIFVELIKVEVKTDDERIDLCHRIANLFPPPHLTRYALAEIIAQLESYGYTCEGGSLEENTIWQSLKELVAVNERGN